MQATIIPHTRIVGRLRRYVNKVHFNLNLSPYINFYAEFGQSSDSLALLNLENNTGFMCEVHINTSTYVNCKAEQIKIIFKQ